MNYITETFKKRRWQIAVGFCFLFFGVFVNWQTVLSAGNFEIANIFDLQKVNTAEFSVAALFFILAFSTLVSEDLTCIGAGLLASQGKISLSLAVLGCAFGIYVGDILLYWAGRLLGRSALKIKPFSWILNEKTLEKSSAWLDKNGGQAVFLSRFTSGLRLPLYFAAGMLRTNFWRFSIYFLIAVAVWTPVLVGVSYWLGESVLENGLFGKFNSLILLLLVFGLFVLIRTVPQLFSWKKRRILWGKIKRRFIWEFWSIRVFYFPVVIYVLWLGIKNGGLNVFTCANPAIPAGGFVGESKKEILDGLKNSTSAAPYLLQFAFISKNLKTDEKISSAENFISQNDLSFPIVIKPDAGERGKGVKIVRSVDELKNELSQTETDLILQEFAEGDEVSVFYYRYPNERSGKIFSITEKQFPNVLGNGRATLEELILQDKRAICLAKSYLEQNAGRLGDVPKNGEAVQIIDIGTHSRGAIFLDGERFITSALEKKVDEICRGYKGFYFGRFDIRISSIEEFKQGKNFKIVELNGVTSEATNIYDPKNSLFDAYRILFRQWKIAFEIGAQNKSSGIKPTPFADLIKLIFGIETAK